MASSNWVNFTPKNQVFSKRSHHSSVFLGNSIYIFGGYDGENYLSDLIEFHVPTSTWRSINYKIDSSIPADTLARCGHSCTVIDDSNFLIFGGYSSDWHNDILLFNVKEATFTIISSENRPSRRWCHSATIDDSQRNLYVFGGYGESKEGKNRLYLNDTYKFDLFSKTWSSIGPLPIHNVLNRVFTSVESTPPSTSSATIAISSNNNNNLLLFPPPRNNHVSWYYNNQLWIFSGAKLNDLWALNLSTNCWRKVQTWGTQVPGPCYGATACILQHFVYIFGGRFQELGYQNTLYRLDLRRSKWNLVQTNNVNDDSVIIYNNNNIGEHLSTSSNITLIENINNSSSLQENDINVRTLDGHIQKVPSCRRNHSACMDTRTQTLYIFGGYGENKYLNESMFLKLTTRPGAMKLLESLQHHENLFDCTFKFSPNC